MIKKQFLSKLGLGLVASVFTASAFAQEATIESKKTSIAGPALVKTYGEVQLRLFNDYFKTGDGEVSDATSYQFLRPLVGASVLGGAADVTFRTMVLKEANSTQVHQLLPIVNLTVNNFNFGPLTVTPYIEHYLPGKRYSSASRQFIDMDTFTEFYVDNALSYDVATAAGPVTLMGGIELSTTLYSTAQTSNVRDTNGEFALTSNGDQETTPARDATFGHEWNFGAKFAPSATNGLSVSLHQFLTNNHTPSYTRNAAGELEDDASYALSQETWQRLGVTYKVNDVLSLVNFTDVHQQGVFKGMREGSAGISNQTRLIYTLF